MQDDRDNDAKNGLTDSTPVDSGPAHAPDGQNSAGKADIVCLAASRAHRTERILSELRMSWDTLRGSRAIPERIDVEPRALRNALSYAFILERIAPGAARFRLAGRHLIDLMGMEVRGMPLCALFNPPSRGHLSDVLETVFAGPQIVELSMLSPAGYGRPELAGRMLLLPLRSDLGDVTRALGAVVCEGAIGTPPRRFELTAEELTPVIPGARTLRPSPSRAGFAEPPEPWRPPVQKPRPKTLPGPISGDVAGDRPTIPVPTTPVTAPPSPCSDNDSPVDGSGGNHAGGGDDPAARRKGFRVIPGGR